MRWSGRVEVQHHFARAHRQQTVFNHRRIVGELVAAGGLVVGKFQPVQRAGQAQAVIDRAEQEHAAVAGEVPGGELGNDLAGAEVGEEKWLLATVCRARGGEVRLVRAFIQSSSDALPASPFIPR